MTLRTDDRDPRVPYVRLACAELAAADVFPDADAWRAIWTPANPESDVHVEVWRDGAANVWQPDNELLTLAPVEVPVHHTDQARAVEVTTC